VNPKYVLQVEHNHCNLSLRSDIAPAVAQLALLHVAHIAAQLACMRWVLPELVQALREQWDPSIA
jgi:hypothetical protein